MSLRKPLLWAVLLIVAFLRSCLAEPKAGEFPQRRGAGLTQSEISLARIDSSYASRELSQFEEVLDSKAAVNLEDARTAIGINLAAKDAVGGDASQIASLANPEKGKPLQIVREGVPLAVTSWLTVLWMTSLMGGAAGLGSLPFFLVGSLSKEWSALANALACGVMVACSFDLVHEGQPYGGGLVILGIILGTLFISASQQYLDDFEDVKFQGLQGINARKILLMIGIMAAHAFGEGAGVGVSFCGTRGWAQGVLVTLAIGLHNVPEGLAVSTVLVARGIPPRKALLWTLFTAMPQPLVAVPSYLFVDTFKNLLPVALGFAAGCMVWMVFAELLPDALADASHAKVASTATFAAAWLEALRMLLVTFEGADGAFALPPLFTWPVAKQALQFVIPSMLIGLIAGLTSRHVVKTKGSCLALAAGMLSWQGGSNLVHVIISSKLQDLVSNSIAGVSGAAAMLLLFRMLQTKQTGKVKQGGTPKKIVDQVVVAADTEPSTTNGYYQPVHRSDHSFLDLETGGLETKVFEPYRVRESVANGIPTTAMLTVAVFSLCRGYQVAHTSAALNNALSSSWLPTIIEYALFDKKKQTLHQKGDPKALYPSMTVSAILRSFGAKKAQHLATAAFAGIQALMTVFERRHIELLKYPDFSLQVGSFASGAALTAGLFSISLLAIMSQLFSSPNATRATF